MTRNRALAPTRLSLAVAHHNEAMTIHIPTPLRTYTNQQETVDITGTTVAAGLQGLIETYPALKTHLFTPDGKLRSFVNIYVGDEDLRYLPEGENTGVPDAAEITIIPSIAGGADDPTSPSASPRCRP